ncbi:transcriptional regulator [Oleomonas cavernae]|uniref:Transcriptional regulator n=1 Tax=Oleomonas cavernae TaxID=2320859 RepID=A0A418WGL6_9PROT|nr:helix-turn-helix domain-containing protein [Oleomonas cavernae]RJF89176.1 transcriptional regulator [Oleomonas cavernae]
MVAKTDLSGFNCSLARSLDIVGDWWTLLILRDAFLGADRFGEFQASLGIAKNILARRLEALVDQGMLERAGTAARPTYWPTQKSRDLLPAMLALMQWGDRWTAQGRPPMRAVDPAGNEIAPVTLRDAGGKTVPPADVRFVPGPGATPRTRGYMAAVQAKVAGD